MRSRRRATSRSNNSRRMLSGSASSRWFPPSAAAPDQDANGDEIFVPDAAKIAALTTRLVPLPTPANPGDRVRVRLLSGVGPLDVDALLHAQLVPRDEQVTIVGNADGF